MKDHIQLGIVEDHSLVREGLVSMLKDYSRIKVVFSVSNGQELLDKLRVATPDIILLDIKMPVMGGSEAVDSIKKKYPKLKIIIITAFSEDFHIVEFVKKGVNSFLFKDCKIDELKDAIYSVHEQETFFNQYVSKIIAKELAQPRELSGINDSGLSAQELEIVRLICQDKTSKEIGEMLSLSLKTIEFRRSKILRKTKSKNVTALVRYAIDNKLVKS